MKKVELNSCPFCGGKVTLEKGLRGSRYILCDGCGAMVWFMPEVRDVPAAFNRRADNGGKR